MPERDRRLHPHMPEGMMNLDNGKEYPELSGVALLLDIFAILGCGALVMFAVLGMAVTVMSLSR